MDKIAVKYKTFWVSLALIFITFAVFQQLRKHDFINYDDDKYVTENPHVNVGLTRESVIWAFTTPHGGTSYWHPLTWLSHMLDCELFGLDPGWHHLTNLLLHIINTVLLFLVFKNMTGALWKSAFVAAVFALHPLHIESVAWVAERKDVLSGFFFTLTIAAYSRYAGRPRIGRYLLVVLALALGLMAKPMLVTLPFLLLLLDYWPLGRLKNSPTVFRRLVWEKIPFFALSAISSVVTFLVQRNVGAVAGVNVFSLDIRITNALIAYVKYILKMIWPSRLAILYPHPRSVLPALQIVFAVVVLLGITVFIVRLASKYKYLFVGWFWFLGTLVPVIGLVQVGSQAMADRYSYISLTGLFVIIAWGFSDVLAKLSHKKILLGSAAVLSLLALAVCSFIQLQHWRNGVTLYLHTLKVTDNNYIIHNNLGFAFHLEGKFDQAVSHYQQALQIEPNYFDARNNLSYTLESQGKIDEAVSQYQKVLQVMPDNIEANNNLGVIFQSRGKINEAVSCFNRVLRVAPHHAAAHYNLGNIFRSQGKSSQAIAHYLEALKADPNFFKAHKQLGIMFASKGRFGEAAGHFQQALIFRPNDADLYNNLGLTLLSRGRLDEAVSCFQQAIKLRPNYARANHNLGLVLRSQGRVSEAVDSFRKALQIKPDYLPSLNSLALILATHSDPALRDADRAITLAERAVELTNYKDAVVLRTLAAAYAAAGQFDRAIETTEIAIGLASASGNNSLADYLQKQLQLYKQAKSSP